jgi:hypothetical protein
VYSGNKPRLRVIGWANIVLGWLLPIRLAIVFLDSGPVSYVWPSILMATLIAGMLAALSIRSGWSVLEGRRRVVGLMAITAGVWLGYCAAGIAGWILYASNYRWNKLSDWEWSIGPFEIPSFLEAILFIWWQYCPIVVVSEARKVGPPPLSPPWGRTFATLLAGILLGAFIRLVQMAVDFDNYARGVRA